MTLANVVVSSVLASLFVGAAFASAPADPSPEVQQLVALEERWIRAENEHDRETLREILDERFLAITNSGISNREEFIANVTSGPIDPTQTQTLSDRTFLVDGDTAVVTEIDRVTGTRDGEPVEFAVRITTTYIRREGEWRALVGVFGKAPAAD